MCTLRCNFVLLHLSFFIRRNEDVQFELNRSMWCGGASARCGPNIIKYKPLQRFCHTHTQKNQSVFASLGAIRGVSAPDVNCISINFTAYYLAYYELVPLRVCVCVPLSLTVQLPPPRQHITSRKHLKFAVWENAHQSLQHFLVFSSAALCCCMAVALLNDCGTISVAIAIKMALYSATKRRQEKDKRKERQADGEY